MVGIQLFRFLKPPALVGAFNQEKAQDTRRGLLRDCENIADGSFAALRISQQPSLLGTALSDTKYHYSRTVSSDH